MQPIKAVIWDLDGTLLNTLDDLTAAVNAALRLHAMPERTADEVRTFIGNGVRKLIERSMPCADDADEVDRVLADFRVYYRDHHTDLTAPYEGVVDTLRALKAAGILSVVVSNKIEPEAIALARHFFPDLLDAVVGDAPPRPAKPAPDGVLIALDKLGVAVEQTVFVGDMTVDIITARNLGIPCLAVTWGFSTVDTLRDAGAPHIIDRPHQVVEFVKAKG